MPDANIVVVRIQRRARVPHGASASVPRITPSSHGEVVAKLIGGFKKMIASQRRCARRELTASGYFIAEFGEIEVAGCKDGDYYAEERKSAGAWL
jgi:hypothetical protein